MTSRLLSAKYGEDGGLVLGAFVDGALKGFVSVEAGLFGRREGVSGFVQHSRV